MINKYIDNVDQILSKAAKGNLNKVKTSKEQHPDSRSEIVLLTRKLNLFYILVARLKPMYLALI